MAGGHEVDLFAVQPRVGLEEYLVPERFVAHHRALAERIASLRASAGPSIPSLAVWPEYVATFLVLAGRAREVGTAATTRDALRRVVARHPAAVAAAMVRLRSAMLVPVVLAWLSPPAHALWVDTFSAIARDFGLWVVAGSGLFAPNRFGRVAAPYAPASARVRNVSYAFSPDGALAGITGKVNLVPTQEDVLGLSPAPLHELGVVDAEVGRFATLICYDGFREPHSAHEPGFVPCAEIVDRMGAEIVAQPSANAWPWDGAWAFNEPGEHTLRRDQWFAEGMAAQLPTLSSVRYVVNPQLVGEILDNRFEAPSLILGRGGPGAEVLARAGDPHEETVLHARVSVSGQAWRHIGRFPGAR